MKYTTITRKGHELTAEWTGRCIQLTVWRDLHPLVEWAFTPAYAVVRFTWLLENA
jgi:hypothetical protein